MRAAWFSIILLAALLGAGMFLAKPASASADVALNTYLTPDGNRYFIEDGGSMPVGSTLRISVFTDLYSCDPVTVYWGDGAVETRTYGGNLVQSWEHMYNATGTYTIRATEPCGDGGATRTVIVANGGLAIFDPSSALFFPTLFGLFLGLGALGMALGKPRVNPKVSPSASLDPNALRGPPSPVPPTPFGTPPSFAANLVSYRDIPPGAPRQPDPRLPMKEGEPTNLDQPLSCPACKVGKLGFVAGGWFCLNPNCPLRPAEQPWQRIVHGL